MDAAAPDPHATTARTSAALGPDVSGAPGAPDLVDDALPVHDLLGPGARDLFAAAVAATGTRVVEVVDATPVQLLHHRGRSLTVAHEVRLRHRPPTSGPAAQRDERTDDDTGDRTGPHESTEPRETIETTELMVAAAGRRPPRGSLVLGHGPHQVVVWALPHDPWLPGLAELLVDERRAALLAQVGIEEPTVAHLRSYRPGRRAVVEVRGATTRAFAKVVLPRKVVALQDRHCALASVAPVPTSLGWSASAGVVVLAALPGATLGEALLAPDTDWGALPGPEVVLAVLDGLGAVDGLATAGDGATAGGAVEVSWRTREWAQQLGAVVPDLDRRLRALVAGLAPFEAEARAEPVVVVHGDLYEAQLVIDGPRITGLLDVDTVGPGRRVDDLATCIGHLAVLALGRPRQQAIEAYAAALLAGFDRHVDPALLRAAVAGVVLGLATGPLRVLEPDWQAHTAARVAVAERWLASALAVRSGRVRLPVELTAAVGAPT